MDLSDLINFIFHIDTFLGQMIVMFGIWLYVVLFILVFCETGLVVTPFIPGDSLLFVTGAFAANGVLNLAELWFVFAIAAIVGDTINYSIGHYIGPRAFTTKSKYLKQEYLLQAQQFYEKHGFAAVFLCRFFPILRTFAPFVAGIGEMKYRKFIIYNVSGAISWVSLFLFAGFFFGNIPWVAANMSLLVYAIIFISMLPAISSVLKNAMQSRKKKKATNVETETKNEPQA